MLVKEYRICMPLTTDEYRVGQLYTISKHSHQESDRGEGVEVVKNEPHEDPVHGPGQFTEKRVHLSSFVSFSVSPLLPWDIWNYLTTDAEYTCSFLPKFSIYIETKYEDNCGNSTNVFLNEKILGDHEVMFLDIAFDEIPDRYYRSLEDLRSFCSAKTGRGPLQEGWREHTQPIMCSYKLVTVKFEVWGLQTRVEQFVHKVIRDILLIGHRQAFAWVDEWSGMTMDEVRLYEKETQQATNDIVGVMTPTISISEVHLPPSTQSAPSSAPSTPLSGEAPEFLHVPKDRQRKKSAPEMLSLPVLRERSNLE
ncbi:cytoplasmic phosphatidylinositol transfer protein 1-like isoform X1 [Ahaetulla prasina]|uniref:cytoplasmic phosphatidylinositol transfer protein 1-like isoform X1 n=1 Tax=Ahaetulla prasina TaxID=499056 RepID=UPI002649EC08|nr:cytoplasmic phosphatidylinositol transfer protein 1-like isoform X1 [Ahaetulla prasina]XP_058013764.1 cytoplasmic phosphatidylinositol transfer protein 1-like isoform X1 [Ahaetulla prasina]XP_058013765.1 cytoplasmic phosphatidylinositol transfer protein 1-like isoform X1 [Ahaetulla prasina]XP_058013766.1 cytoplasmic phosphatidylinositol transfer protein 1-like isoform X1 [Ahaetulla prasina]